MCHDRLLLGFLLSWLCWQPTGAGETQPLAVDQLNAAPVYRKAAALLTKLPEDFQGKTTEIINNGWNDGDQVMSNLLAANQEAIQEFKRASQREHCQFTTTPPPRVDANTEPPRFMDEIKLARLVLVEGRRWEMEQRSDLALNDDLAVLNFAAHLGEQQYFVLFSKLTELIVRKLAFVPIVDSVRQEALDAKNCRYLLERLIELRRRVAGLERAFEEENEVMRNTLRTVEAEAMNKGRYNEAFFTRLHAEYEATQKEYLRYLVPAFRENDPKAYEERAQKFVAEVKQELKPLNIAWESLKGIVGLPQGIDSPALVARVLCSVSAPSYGKLITRYYVSLGEFDVLIAATAVRLYELEHGQTPENLQILVPAYLAELPHDPFDNFGVLKYVKKSEKGWVVYSFGPDRQDNQGLQEYDEKGSQIGDIVISSS